MQTHSKTKWMSWFDEAGWSFFVQLGSTFGWSKIKFAFSCIVSCWIENLRSKLHVTVWIFLSRTSTLVISRVGKEKHTRQIQVEINFKRNINSINLVTSCDSFTYTYTPLNQCHITKPYFLFIIITLDELVFLSLLRPVVSFLHIISPPFFWFRCFPSAFENAPV